VNVERLRTTILEGAEADAQRLVSEAEARAADELDLARAEAAAAVERAEAEGRAAGRLESARSSALARRRAAGLTLSARRAVHDDFRRAALEAVLALRGGKGYRALLARLEDDARRSLGEHVEVEVDPGEVGGVRARVGRRSVDLTLPALAERCVAALGVRQEELWR
jgi:vacuolar-type H+-ATPase subunit E/Vma4